MVVQYRRHRRRRYKTSEPRGDAAAQDLNAALSHVLKTTKLYFIKELNHTVLMRQNKDILENMSQLLKSNIELCTAAAEIDKLKSEHIINQNKLI